MIDGQKEIAEKFVKMKVLKAGRKSIPKLARKQRIEKKKRNNQKKSKGKN